MRTEMVTDGDREVFLSAVSVFVNGHQKFAGSFKLDEPPGFFAGEFVKDEEGRTKLFQMEVPAIEAAMDLYKQRKKNP